MILAIVGALAGAAGLPSLREGLEPLGFLVGHCWRGEMAKTGERDTHCFESVYGGQHVRERHKVEGGKGVYEGETLYSWDGSGVIFTYWNSLGGVSRGTLRRDGEKLDFGTGSYTAPDGRSLAYSTYWRRLGEDAYEAVTVSADAPSLNRKVTFRRVR
ncbi:MAG TPA: hypothetical protein VGD66_11870 [Allosphingosinicella sp.]|jgi:hypothetical protein